MRLRNSVFRRSLRRNSSNARLKNNLFVIYRIGLIRAPLFVAPLDQVFRHLIYDRNAHVLRRPFRVHWMLATLPEQIRFGYPVGGSFPRKPTSSLRMKLDVLVGKRVAAFFAAVDQALFEPFDGLRLHVRQYSGDAIALDG